MREKGKSGGGLFHVVGAIVGVSSETYVKMLR